MALVLPSARPRVAAALLMLFALTTLGQLRAARAQEVPGPGAEYQGEYQSNDYQSDFAPGYSEYVCGKQSRSTCFGGGWLGVEYLHWRLDGGNDVPPLVTAAPGNTPLVDSPGNLGDPNTEILFGDETLNGDWRNGYRVYGGIWFDCCQCCGLAADYFDTGDDDENFVSPNDGRIISRPFFNTEDNVDDVQLVDVPNELEGTVEVNSSDNFKGGGVDVQHRLWQCCDPCGCGPSSQVYCLAGYRHYQYNSNLDITENLLVLPGTSTPLVPGTTIFVQDRFTTENRFDGGELGMQGFVQQNCWWLDGMVRVAVGSQYRKVTIDGTTINTVPGAGQAQFKGGLLTSEATNIGTYTDRSIAIIPEFRLGVGAQLTNNFSIHAGYNVIIWNAVARAGSQLPPGLQVDPRNLPPIDPNNPGGNEPEFAGINGSPLIAHGLDLGVQFTY